MHAERSDSQPPEHPSDVERSVMAVLLTGDHGLWTRSELEREVAGLHSDPADIEEAIGALYGSGLIHVFGEFVTPTRAARNMDELRM
jgi:hypothetical protein